MIPNHKTIRKSLKIFFSFGMGNQVNSCWNVKIFKKNAYGPLCLCPKHTLNWSIRHPAWSVLGECLWFITQLRWLGSLNNHGAEERAVFMIDFYLIRRVPFRFSQCHQVSQDISLGFLCLKHQRRLYKRFSRSFLKSNSHTAPASNSLSLRPYLKLPLPSGWQI